MPGANLCPPKPHSMQTPPVRTVHKSRHRSNSTCFHGRRRKQPDPHNLIGRWYRRIRYDLTSQHAPRTLNCARSKLLPPLRSPVLHRPTSGMIPQASRIPLSKQRRRPIDAGPVFPGQRAALQTVQAELEAGETLFAFLDDIYCLLPPERVRPVYDLLAHHLHAQAHIRLNSGKTRIWNASGQRPPISRPLGCFSLPPCGAPGPALCRYERSQTKVHTCA